MAAWIDKSRNPAATTPSGGRINNTLCWRINCCKPRVSDSAACIAIYKCNPKSKDGSKVTPNEDEAEDHVWRSIQEEALSDIQQEPILSNYYFASVLGHKSLDSAIANILATKLATPNISSGTLYKVFFCALIEDVKIKEAIRHDLRAVKDRDPACTSYVTCLLNFKGFLACQAHRIAHSLWLRGRKPLALTIQSRVSEAFGVDIHPGAKIGCGIVIDHATGVVIGETSVVGDNVTILHNVTLGGTGKVSGDRHPKIGNGVLIGAGAKILGNVTIGEGAKIGAGSVVLKEVPPNATAVGNPARLVEK